MFHAQCRELSLSTGAFSHSHAHDRSVAAPGPYTIQHWGGKPLHQRMPIVVDPRIHVHGYPNLASCALLVPLLNCSPEMSVGELAQSQRHCKLYSGVQPPDL